MTGCITFPLRLLFTVLLVVGLAAGWIFREDILGFGRRQLGLPDPPSRVGVPSPGDLSTARARMDSVVQARVDSVVLSPAEVASLVLDRLARSPAGSPDSLMVELGDREVTVRARVATAPLPDAIRNLLGSALAERETVEVGGVLGLRREGMGEFGIQRVRVKGLPVPRDLVGRLLDRYLPGVEDATVGFAVPPGISGIRVAPRGAVLYGRGRR